ncbi:cell envelope biogenesis protein TonB [Bacteroidia bacterium]|nr:cell envelope biogenesis protein TonB [Bacteroidia bacterium]
MKKLTKEETFGWSGAIVILLLLILLLSLVYMKAQIKPQEQGVLAIFEEVETEIPELGVPNPANGKEVTSEEASAAPVVPPIPAKPTVAPPKPTTPERVPKTKPTQKPPITNPDPVPVKVTTPSPEEIAEKQRLAEIAEAKRKQELENKQKINAQVSAALAGGQGNGLATNPNSGNGTAAIGDYAGVSIHLEGRERAGNLQRPTYSGEQEGTIVVIITVNPQGNVIDAAIRPNGTNITNNQMRNSAKEAARKTKFNAINDRENATGTITYKYKLN